MSRRLQIRNRLDWFTMILVAAIAVLGWLNITSATAGSEAVDWLAFDGKGGKQLLWLGVCTLIAFLVLNVEGEFFVRISILSYVSLLVVLAAVLVFGKVIGGARSWFAFGSFSLQPSEFAKSTTALMLAWLLSRGDGKLRDLKTRLQSIAIVGLPAGLVLLQPDAGTVLVFGGFVFALYREGLSGNVLVVAFAALVVAVATILTGAGTVTYPFFGPATGVYVLWAVLAGGGGLVLWFLVQSSLPRERKRMRRIGAVAILGALVFSGGMQFGLEKVLAKHQRERLHVLFGLDVGNPDADYNIRHAKAAIGSGGLAGKGYMNGPMTAYAFVPEQETDFIFCTVGEEWGFLGSTAVILLYLTLLLRLIYLAERQRSNFTRVYGYGVASVLFMHLLINVGMVLGLAPVIGIPLPLFSYGGSSLMGFTVLIFILLRLDAERFSVLR